MADMESADERTGLQTFEPEARVGPMVASGVFWTVAVVIAVVFVHGPLRFVLAGVLMLFGLYAINVLRINRNDALIIDDRFITVCHGAAGKATLQRNALTFAKVYAPFPRPGGAGSINLLIRDAYDREVSLRLRYYTGNDIWGPMLAKDLSHCGVEVDARTAYALAHNHAKPGTLVSWQVS